MVGIEGLNAGGGIGGRLSRGFMGWTGVPKAGLDEGIAFSCRRKAAAILRVGYSLVWVTELVVDATS
jgi:hypothetical protein